MPLWNCIIIVTETLFHILEIFPFIPEKAYFRKCDTILQEPWKLFLKILIIYVLVTSGRNFYTVKFSEHPMNWAKMKQSRFFLPLESLLLVFWGEWVYHLSRVHPLLLHSLLVCCFLITVLLPDSGPGKPSPQVFTVASQPLYWLLLLKLQIVPNLSTLLDLIPQLEGHQIFHSGSKSWQS